jgi:Ni/Co efflux regulator RcnB
MVRAANPREDIRTGMRASAMQRGQCSTVNQRARGRMLRPQRGQTWRGMSSAMVLTRRGSATPV